MRQRQATTQQGATGEVVQRIAGRQPGGIACKAGVVELGEQAVDCRAIVAAGLPAEAGVICGEPPRFRKRAGVRMCLGRARDVGNTGATGQRQRQDQGE